MLANIFAFVIVGFICFGIGVFTHMLATKTQRKRNVVAKYKLRMTGTYVLFGGTLDQTAIVSAEVDGRGKRSYYINDLPEDAVWESSSLKAQLDYWVRNGGTIPTQYQVAI